MYDEVQQILERNEISVSKIDLDLDFKVTEFPTSSPSQNPIAMVVIDFSVLDDRAKLVKHHYFYVTIILLELGKQDIFVYV